MDDCQLDCHAGGLWRILLNRTETTGLDLNTERTLVHLYEHLAGALDNCYQMEMTRSQLLSITTPYPQLGSTYLGRLVLEGAGLCAAEPPCVGRRTGSLPGGAGTPGTPAG